MHSNTASIHLVGFGSQGTAWAHLLRDHGWRVNVYLREKRDLLLQGISVFSIDALRAEIGKESNSARIALLIPDLQIGPFYRDYLSGLKNPLTVILAHGYAVYSGDLGEDGKSLGAGHELALFAPKAIGPKLLEAGQGCKRHDLVAAVSCSSNRRTTVLELAGALGFKNENLVEASFSQETIADLISEQTVLCGSLFWLVKWSMNRLRTLGVPEKLIQAECLSELTLIAEMLNERGVDGTLSRISENAKAGVVAVEQAFEKSDLKDVLEALCQNVLNKNFVEFVRKGDYR